MSDNPHAKQADSNMAYSDSVVDMATVDLGDLWIKRAQVEATLAVAYEQRTASLIAMLVDANEAPIPDLDYAKLTETVKERLDLA